MGGLRSGGVNEVPCGNVDEELRVSDGSEDIAPGAGRHSDIPDGSGVRAGNWREQARGRVRVLQGLK
jgi:hypothetical protein